MGERVDIVVSETGSDKAAGNIGAIGTAADKSAASVDKTNSSLANFKVALGAAQSPLQYTINAAGAATTGTTALGQAAAAAATGLGQTASAASRAAPALQQTASAAGQTAQGLGQTADKATKATEATNSLNGVMETLKAALAGIAVYELANQYKELADTFQSIISRLKLVSSSSKEVAATEQLLFEMSNRTRASFKDTADLYLKLAQQAGQLNIDQKSLIPTIETINQLIAISGATSEEARAGLLQFSQGLASNRFQGDELRSVLENLPALGQAIAKGLGTTSAGLRQMGEDGKLSAKLILDALSKQGPEIAKQFSAITPTIGSALQVLKNNILQLVGTYDQLMNSSSRVAQVILLVANNLQTLIRAVAVAGSTIAAFYAGMAIQSAWAAFAAGIAAVMVRLREMQAFIALTGIEVSLFSKALFVLQSPIQAVTGAFAALNAVIRANPIALIITLLGAAAAALYFFGNQIKLTSDGSITALGAVVGIIRTLWDLLKQVGSYIATALGPTFSALGTLISNAFNIALVGLKSLLSFLAQFIPSLQGVSASLDSFGATLVKNMKDASKSTEDATLATKDFGKTFGDTMQTSAGAADVLKKKVGEASEELVQMGRVVPELIPPFMNLVYAHERWERAAKAAVEGYKKDVEEAVKATDYLNTHIRNAMGQMVEATDEWARRSGAYFNSVKEGLTGVASTASSTSDSYSSSVSSMNQATSSLGSGGGSSGLGGATEGQRNFSVYTANNEAQSFYAAAGGKDAGLIGAINSLGSDIANHNPSAVNEIVQVWQRLQSQSTAAKDVIKAQFPFLVDTFRSAGLAFQNGGSFMVGGAGGTDSQLVQFIASPNEEVSVRTPAQQRELAAALAGGSRGKTVIVNMNVSTPDANSFRRSQNQTLLQLKGKLNMV